MKLKNLLKLAGKLAPVLIPAAPLVIAGGKAVIRSQKKGGSLVEELPTIMAGVAAATAARDALRKRAP